MFALYLGLFHTVDRYKNPFTDRVNAGQWAELWLSVPIYGNAFSDPNLGTKNPNMGKPYRGNSKQQIYLLYGFLKYITDVY